MSKNDSLNGTTLPLRKIRQRESAVPKHRYGRYQIADIIIYCLVNYNQFIRISLCRTILRIPDELIVLIYI
mgnify:CR=1 FL=1